MMLTCRVYSGEEAAAMGLANLCVPDTDLDGAVATLCATILANSWHSNAENKRLIYETDSLPLAAGLNHELMRNAGFDPAPPPIPRAPVPRAPVPMAHPDRHPCRARFPDGCMPATVGKPRGLSRWQSSRLCHANFAETS